MRPRTLFYRFRQLAAIVGYRPKPTTDAQVQVQEDPRDWLSRCDVGDPAYAPDGVHWRFDESGNLGRRFLVERGVVVEVQTALEGVDGVYRAVSRSRRTTR